MTEISHDRVSVPIFGISHVDMPVSDLVRSEKIFVDVLGFHVKKRGDGWIDLDAGACTLRLVRTRKVEHPVTVRVLTSDVDGVLRSLRAHGATLMYPPTRTPAQELIAQVSDPDGHGIIVWRELTEDEYDFVPEVPKAMTWMPEAESLLQSLLASVPALFRALARRKVARTTEDLAGASNLVTREHVIRGYILASAKITRYRLRQPLVDHGINPAHYAAEFEA
jgi:catechol 2,3-dioxygenase-like lactoylglutathione lyase family enzyme